ncbi:suppressor of fused domain protein [Actinoplanes sp. ATCC 53533]|uniref:suppressor of fused domain protein n=1 Tax=Actinoplanes sp. ATCC 53533 TaxID=1288362 RepID=UPI0013157245|nr:suppressor of fused domain protein [Actinoplanes sp. ATCC 53533]
MRVPRTGEQPPAWSLKLLDKLGQYVFGNEQPLASGHRMDPGGPITGEPGTRLTALAFAEDPQLPRIESPLGRALFLTVVGITADELARMKATSTDQVLAELSPLLITDPAR